MRRTFTLQVHSGGRAHMHHCELCGRDKPCGYQNCREPRTDTCVDCFTAQDCPSCGEHMDLRWECDDSEADGTPVRTSFSGVCTCGVWARFTDLHDGRGPLIVNQHGQGRKRARHVGRRRSR